MSPERWRRIEEIFRTTVDRPEPERDAYLTHVCDGDEDLRSEVLSLLERDTAEDFIRAPIANVALAFTAKSKDDLTGERVGPYRVTQLIGRGGMGDVYEAERDDEHFRQQVAIKVIKRGMDMDFVRDRFLRERQILASLDHPHIARLFDGGATPDGSPYFVMELVTGEPITAYCRRHQLSVNEKLKLFRKVCFAVQHAHQKLVIHRDLKPSNILIAPSAAGKDGEPKLLDFGIAKLLSPEQLDASQAHTRTETALRLMTPEYASPEQARGEVVATTTDVYSLGVVLYELLTERRPHEFKTYSPAEIERAICETEIEEPSKIVGRMTGASAKLSRQLAGDLDNIALMAMRKEPERRYQSVERFSADLHRYLTGLPVTARPDSLGYRGGKFVRRHRVAVVAAALMLISLLGGIVATTFAARQARAERARAERRFAQVRALANTFLFDFHDKIQNTPGTTEARAMVAKTAMEYLDSLAREADGDPQLEWELAVAYQKVGDVQGDPWSPNLGYSQEAMRSYQKSLELAQRLSRGGANDLKMSRLLAQGYFKLGALQAQSGGQVSAAHEVLSRAVAAAEKLEQQTHDLEDILLLQNSYIRLSDTWLDTGDPVSALAGYRREMRLAERRIVEFPSDVARLNLAMSHSHVAEALNSLGDLPGAIEGYRKSLALADELAPKNAADPYYLRMRMIALIWLGDLSGNPSYINQGDARAALQYYRESLAVAEQMAALDPKNARARHDLAGGHRLVAEILSLDKAAQAVEHYRKSLGILRALLAADPKEAQLLRREVYSLKGLAGALGSLGDRQGALQNLRQALQISRELFRRDDNLSARAELHAVLLPLADLLLEAGERDAALAHYRESLTLAETPPVEQSRDVYVRWRLADSYAGLSRCAAARGGAAAGTRSGSRTVTATRA
ncbi:MAG: protein kinase domain-containing protein, partial [Blastocatellia bacterium]